MNKNLLAAALSALVIAAPFTAQAGGPNPGFGSGPGFGPNPGFGSGPSFGPNPSFGQGPGFGPGPGAGCPLHSQCLMDDGGPGRMGPGRMGPGGGIDAHLAMMSARLQLSPEQRDEIRNILEVQQATRQVIATALREAMREQVDSVLTPEQQALHARMMARRDQGWGGMGGPGHCALGRGPGPRWRPARGAGDVATAGPVPAASAVVGPVSSAMVNPAAPGEPPVARPEPAPAATLAPPAAQ